MERFFAYWSHWINLNQETREYLSQHSQIRSYAAGNDFVLAGEARPFWCFVLSGLVAGLERLGNHRYSYNWLALPGDYFTGTIHLFTQRPPSSNIQFLRDTQLLLIPAPAMRFAQQHFSGISEILHVLKQRRILHQEALLLLLLLDTNRRYTTFRKGMHHLYALLSEKEQIAYLRMSRSQFFAAKSAWKEQ
ncbi:Crp/Fnr family transcriptional regulator [Parapedobacter koreensis]|uniref:cAMP-binding domain of CRP or a regulatory subunit of cAMP-dependent protein kinases n=1 Tax=Parapedobacter koreensis TaxID=332977 RepID=A0A1H7HU28_9SPHI|nr:Crp/Fnr family transcriptional regulator [Parapedobacter koreensis]SEK53801.1 cAMP-binding domain of CRP or a regulatory subunit of cAMP-dependent protein kinases [Parapedobacter koreensis]